MFDGTTESTREIPQKSRRTLMSLQEYEITRGSPNLLKIKPISLHWLHSYPVFHRMKYKWLDFLEEITEIL